MKYIVRRASTSVIDDKTKCPVEGAVLTSIPHVEYTSLTIEEYDRRVNIRDYRYPQWLDKGTDHSTEVIDGNLYNTRVVGNKEHWLIDINSLEELNEFIHNNDEVIIFPPDIGGYFTIMIYDDYIE